LARDCAPRAGGCDLICGEGPSSRDKRYDGSPWDRMRCAASGCENASGMKFCGECGSSLRAGIQDAAWTIPRRWSFAASAGRRWPQSLGTCATRSTRMHPKASRREDPNHAHRPRVQSLPASHYRRRWLRADLKLRPGPQITPLRFGLRRYRLSRSSIVFEHQCLSL
jgi:hypothetical protein